jgi:hypothetical protein
MTSKLIIGRQGMTELPDLLGLKRGEKLIEIDREVLLSFLIRELFMKMMSRDGSNKGPVDLRNEDSIFGAISTI